ncbi:type II toxin-antitoxin system Phd/YefM family antitoxin [Enterococcus innesii]|nr:type II toxin-antitoxin system Phd/YefM family antitoxin [Enterococcus innesii]
MTTTTYTNFRQNLKGFMREVNDDADVITVTSNDGNNIVVLSEKDYASIMETVHLLSSDANSKHLEESKEQLESGKTISTSLEDL